MTHEAPPPSARLLELITGHWVTAALHAAARLRVADHIGRGAATTAALAEATGAHEPSLFRLLRALASLGVLVETEPRTFRCTEIGARLAADHPESMRGMALFQGAPPHWAGWGAFESAVRTGRSSFESVHGMRFFDYLQTDPEFSEDFNDGMTSMSAAAAEAVVASYDFSGIGTLVDIGGGHGHLLARIVAAHPGLRGVVADLPHVVAGAPATFARHGVADRCTAAPADFFEALPPADAYIAKHIVHDWDDAHAARILRSATRGLAPGGRVLIVDTVIEPGNAPSMAKLLDLEMLHATHGGKERTAEEFDALFALVGLRRTRIVPTGTLVSIDEARAAT